MPGSKPAASLKRLRQFGLSLPGTEPKSPWPGHDDVAVNNKTFAYLSVAEGHLHVSVKLPATGRDVLRLPHTAPAGYGLGKAGWVTIDFPADAPVPLDTVKRWMLESYRAQAPKRLVKTLEAEQPWVLAGGVPDT